MSKRKVDDIVQDANDEEVEVEVAVEKAENGNESSSTTPTTTDDGEIMLNASNVNESTQDMEIVVDTAFESNNDNDNDDGVKDDEKQSLPDINGVNHDKDVVAATESPAKRQFNNRSEVRKPLSAWTIYCNENREQLKRDNPSIAVADILKVLAEKYRSLLPTEMERLNGLASVDKQRYLSEIQQVKESTADKSSGTSKYGLTSDLIIPAGRVRKTIKMDPEVKALGKEAVLSVTRATELFIGYLTEKSISTAASRGARTIKDTDVIQAIHSIERLEFLSLDFPRKAPDSQRFLHERNQKTSSNSNANKTSAVVGKGAITNFFTNKPSESSGIVSAENESDNMLTDQTAEETSHRRDEDARSTTVHSVDGHSIDQTFSDETPEESALPL